GTIFKINSQGISSEVVSFGGNNSINGRNPNGVILGRDGSFYGTTFAGDTNGAPPDLSKFATKSTNGVWTLINTNRPFPGVKPDLGTVFKMTPDGKITTLAVFNRTNGCYPTAGLTEGQNGHFYGTTSEGGVGKNPRGTIFCLTIAPTS